MIMPWGKYKGEPLSSIPLSYLTHSLENWELDAALRHAIAAEVLRRVAALCPDCNGHGEVQRLREAVEATRRALAVKYHPDRRGGDHTLMKVVNEFASSLWQHLPAEGWTPTDD